MYIKDANISTIKVIKCTLWVILCKPYPGRAARIALLGGTSLGGIACSAGQGVRSRGQSEPPQQLYLRDEFLPFSYSPHGQIQARKSVYVYRRQLSQLL